MSMEPRVIVVGAGLAGLRCAAILHEAGVEVLVLEASNVVGGRVLQTDTFVPVGDRGDGCKACLCLYISALLSHTTYP